jgi:hypothetical protein
MMKTFIYRIHFIIKNSWTGKEPARCEEAKVEHPVFDTEGKSLAMKLGIILILPENWSVFYKLFYAIPKGDFSSLPGRKK